MTATTQGKTARPKFGEFEIIRKIGEGGLAQIYLATQKSLGRYIAIKVLHPKISEKDDLIKRFERESLTLARLSHPNIVHVIDRGKESGCVYFAMEYIEGTNFSELINDPEFPRDKKLYIIVQVLKGLDYAHKNGVIHRDIKPANILIDKEENALIADFGIAQFLEPEIGDRTETGMVMGTYAYMSPEQKEDSANVDCTTDLFAVGVMLYEALVGRRPMGRFKLPSELNDSLSRDYDEIINKALAQRPQDRYQKAVEMKDDLLAAMHQDGKPAESTSPPAGRIKNFIGNCSFLDALSDGPFGSTYLVEDRTSHALYVIKKQNKPDVGLKEAKLLSNLVHPNILNVHGAGSDQAKLVIVMDYAQGGSLADRMVKPSGWREALRAMKQIVSGMDFAHKNNILHGNLRPSNILYDRDDVVKIADFSLISHADKKEVNYYAAPERRKSKLSDIYSAGVIFYQLLTNRAPTTDSSGRFLWVDSHRSIPTELKQLIDRMLKNSPSDRIQSFAEIQERLAAFETDPQPRPTISSEPEGDSATRRLLLWGGLFIVVLILALIYFSGLLS